MKTVTAHVSSVVEVKRFELLCEELRSNATDGGCLVADV